MFIAEVSQVTSSRLRFERASLMEFEPLWPPFLHDFYAAFPARDTGNLASQVIMSGYEQTDTDGAAVVLTVPPKVSASARYSSESCPGLPTSESQFGSLQCPV